MLEGTRIDHRVDVELVLLVVDERQPVDLTGPGKDRGGRGDPLHAGEKVGELIDVAGREVVQVYVGDAVPVGDERQLRPVGRPLGAHVAAPLHVVEVHDLVRLQVVERDPRPAELERGEVGAGPAVGDKGEGAPVRGPDRVQVGVLVVGEAAEPGPVDVDDEEVGEPAVEPAEGDLLPVGTERGREDAGQRDLDPARDPVAPHVDDEEVVLGTALGREREEAAVGAPVHRAVDEPVGLVVARGGGLEEAALDAAGGAVGQPEVDAVAAPLAEEGDLRPIGREGGGDVVGPAVAVPRQQLGAEVARLLLVPDGREEMALDGVVPLLGELLAVHPERAPDAAVEAAGERALEQGAHRLVAPPLADVGEQRVAIAVGEDVGIERHLFDRGELPFEGRIAQPHRGIGIVRPDREVLGHPFHEPAGRVDRHEGADVPGAAAGPDVVLELVHHLVREHVLEVGVGTGEGEHVPVLVRIGDPFDPLAHAAGDGVGLREVGMRRVEDDRLPLAELVVQDPRQARVAPLRHPGGIQRRLAFFLVEVDVEVFGLDDLEVEGAVLDAVLSEVLGGQGASRPEGQEPEAEQGPPSDQCDRATV